MIVLLIIALVAGFVSAIFWLNGKETVAKGSVIRCFVGEYADTSVLAEMPRDLVPANEAGSAFQEMTVIALEMLSSRYLIKGGVEIFFQKMSAFVYIKVV